MTQPDPADTIAAISTPPGEAGIGIVRLSGPRAAAIARKIFRPRRPHSSWRSHRLYLGQIVDPQGEIIDEVLLTWMQAPHTYTREDVVEINCHSGYGVLSRLLSLVLDQGARLAQPGEFTLRAFLSGRIDLTQAEAVLEVIRARTDASLQVAAGHLQGSLGRSLVQIREALLDLLARVEAALDFPEEAEELSPETLEEGLAAQIAGPGTPHRHLPGRAAAPGGLADGHRRTPQRRQIEPPEPSPGPGPGHRHRDSRHHPGPHRGGHHPGGYHGAPQRHRRAAGPARDRLEELGIQRTRERLAQADLVLYLVDGSAPLSREDREALEELAGRRGLAVINKVDLPLVLQETDLQGPHPCRVVHISALTGQGIEALKQAMVDLALGGGLKLTGEMVTQARHQQHLENCLAYLAQARGLLVSYHEAPAWELVALELQEAIREVGEITGQEVGDEVLERIFSEFCLGK